jgi:LmbE family N-acetylglucosaminyl deacetylase
MKIFQNILVVAAHPDDEMLGCGGTLSRLRAGGAHVCILLLGEGSTARETNAAGFDAVRSGASASVLAAAKVLDISEVRFIGLPDNRFDTVPLLDVIKAVESVKRAVQPDLVLTHHAGDLNIDHALTQRAVMTAFRPLPGEKPVSILSFEVLSSTEYAPPGFAAPFQPNVYVDITEHLEAKQKALAAYASEMRPWPHPRSYKAVEHLARLRGSQCGVEAAEAFALCRGVF